MSDLMANKNTVDSHLFFPPKANLNCFYNKKKTLCIRKHDIKQRIMPSFKLLLFGHRNLIINTTQTAVINILRFLGSYCNINSFPKTVTVILLKMYVDKYTKR